MRCFHPACVQLISRTFSLCSLCSDPVLAASLLEAKDSVNVLFILPCVSFSFSPVFNLCRLDVLSFFKKDGFYSVLCSTCNPTNRLVQTDTGSSIRCTCREPDSSTTCSRLLITLWQTQFWTGGRPLGAQLEMNASDWSVEQWQKTKELYMCLRQIIKIPTDLFWQTGVWLCLFS